MRIKLENGTEDNLWTDLPHAPRQGDVIATQYAVYQIIESAGGDLVGVPLKDESLRQYDNR